MSHAHRLAFALALAAACGGAERPPHRAAAPPPGGGDPIRSGPAAVAPAAVPLRPPDDYGARGPWPVGAVTVEHGGRAVEIWYPAAPGSAESSAPARYDLRGHLPPAEAARIPDADNPWQPCDCYRDLPLDRARGPYPLVLFLHGAGSFRSQSAALTTHWASRGMVVVAPDLPAINLRTALGDLDLGNPFDHAAAVLRAARAGDGPFARLAGAVDPARVALVGHSFGGGVAARLRDEEGVAAVVVMASGGVPSGAREVLATILGGTRDGVVPYARQQRGFEDTPAPARLIGLRDAGHLAFSDLCAIGRADGGILTIARRHGVTVPGLVATLAEDGCRDGDLGFEPATEVVRFATAASLEQALSGDPRAAPALRALDRRFPAVSELREK